MKVKKADTRKGNRHRKQLQLEVSVTGADGKTYTEQTHYINEIDHIRNSDMVVYYSDPDNAVHDSRKQKGMDGRRTVARLEGVNERTIRRMSRRELYFTVRAWYHFIYGRPSLVAHMHTCAYRKPSGTGKSYICSSAPNFEDRMIAAIDSGESYAERFRPAQLPVITLDAAECERMQMTFTASYPQPAKNKVGRFVQKAPFGDMDMEEEMSFRAAGVSKEHSDS